MRIGAGGRLRARGSLSVLVVLTSLLALAFAGSPSAHAAKKPGRPNLLLVLVDDQATNTFNRALMPKTFRRLVDHGTRFTDGLAAPPLCCPDRAGILTGQYPHHHGVLSNDPGYPSLIGKGNTLPVWLRRAGYRTAFVGKFLNGYETFAGNSPAPGFDRWFGFNDRPGYYDYTVSADGAPRSYGETRRAYSTDVFTRRANRFIDAQRGNRNPFFLWLSYNAPHSARGNSPYCDHDVPIPPTDADYLRYAHLPLPQPQSFNEANVADKPAAVSGLPPVGPTSKAALKRRYRCTAAAMAEVDLDLNRVMRELGHTGQLKNTIVAYLSDNGYFFGEHRITKGKSLPYEPALRVPFAIRVPRRQRDGHVVHRSTQVVSNVDIASTLLDYAGGAHPCAGGGRCRVLDGRSLRPLLSPGGGPWPANRAVLSEIAADQAQYTALRSRHRMYAEYSDGERELYDLRTDPFELRNLDGQTAYAADEARLAARLAALRHCAGTSGPNAC